MAKEFKIVVDDGSVRVPIENKHGVELGEFMFRPTDVGIVKRYNTAVSKFESVMEPLDKAIEEAQKKAEEDGTGDMDMEVASAAIEEAEKRLYELVDYIFDGDMSGAFFKNMNPFSPVGGKCYCEIAMENLGMFINQQFNSETKKISKRVSEYTKNYMKGNGK